METAQSGVVDDPREGEENNMSDDTPNGDIQSADEICARLTDGLRRAQRRADEAIETTDAQGEELVRHNRAFGVVVEHLGAHDGLFEELDSRTGIIGSSTASAHARVDTLARLVHVIPTWVYGVGALVGVLSGFAWGAHDWTSTIEIADQTTEVTYLADAWWAAVMFGTGVGLLVAAVLTFFAGTNASSGVQTSAEASASAGNSDGPVRSFRENYRRARNERAGNGGSDENPPAASGDDASSDNQRPQRRTNQTQETAPAASATSGSSASARS